MNFAVGKLFSSQRVCVNFNSELNRLQSAVDTHKALKSLEIFSRECLLYTFIYLLTIYGHRRRQCPSTFLAYSVHGHIEFCCGFCVRRT